MNGESPTVDTVKVDPPLAPGATVTEDGDREAAGPAGETDSVRLTVPEKPLTLVIMTVVDPEEPCGMFSELVARIRSKSGPVTPLTSVGVFDMGRTKRKAMNRMLMAATPVVETLTRATIG